MKKKCLREYEISYRQMEKGKKKTKGIDIKIISLCILVTVFYLLSLK